MSSFEFVAEIARSGRAKCKACKKFLAKDVNRLGFRRLIDPAKADTIEESARHRLEAVSWYHPATKCLGIFKKEKWWSDNCPAIDEVAGVDDIDDEEREELEKVLDCMREGNFGNSSKKKSGSKSAKSSKGGGSGSEDEEEASGDEESVEEKPKSKPAAREKRKRPARRQSSEEERSGSDASGSESGSDEESTPAKKRKGAKGTPVKSPKKGAGKPADFDYVAEALEDEQIDQIRDVGLKLTKKTAALLREQLKLNKQVQSGRKEELVARVAECQVLGCLPKCPECGGGTLKWNSTSGEYHCPGFFDDEHFKRCSFRSTDVKRTTWVDA